MHIVDLSNELFIEMGSDTSTSNAAISFWIRAQVGTINNLLFEDFYIDTINGTYEILDGGGNEISETAAAIIKQMYRIYDYNIRIRNAFNSLATDSILRVEDDGSSVTRVNKNEISKNLGTLKNLEQENLDKLVTAYKLKQSTPRDVSGDDTVPGFYGEHNIVNPRDYSPYY